jgi:hypothetical protein
MSRVPGRARRILARRVDTAARVLLLSPHAMSSPDWITLVPAGASTRARDARPVAICRAAWVWWSNH